MNQLFQHKFKNRILAALPKEEIERLLPRLSPVTLKLKQPLDGGVNYAYFIEEGIASVVVSMDDGTTVDTGLIGKDGGSAFLCSWARRVCRRIRSSK